MGVDEHFFSPDASFLIIPHCFLGFRSRLQVPERAFRARFQFTGHRSPSSTPFRASLADIVRASLAILNRL